MTADERRVRSSRAGGRTAVYGASDDLLEFTGAVFEELPIDVDHDWRIAFSHGPVLVLYSDNQGDELVWRFRLDPDGHGPAEIEFWPVRLDGHGDDEDDCPDYSEKAVLEVPGETTIEVVRL